MENNIDDNDNESEDDSFDPSSPSSPTNQAKEGDDQASGGSLSEPLRKPSTSRRKQAEEEYQLINNLSQSIANKQKRKRPEKKNDTIYDALEIM